MQQANDEMEEARQNGKGVYPVPLSQWRHPQGNCLYARVISCSSLPTNGPTGKSKGLRYCLKNTRTSKRHTDCAIPADDLCQKHNQGSARLSMARWYNKVEEAGFRSFNVIAATFYEHYDEILNFYNNRSSNALAESFNAKIKLFRANLRGVVDKKFFLFRIANLYAYPH